MFDAIVVGSGMSGGWAAKELCERGPQDAGDRARPAYRARRRLYRLAARPGRLDNFGMVPEDEVARRLSGPEPCYAFSTANKHFWVKDSEHPYTIADGQALRLDPRLSSRRPLADVGAAVLPAERDGFRSQRQGRPRRPTGRSAMTTWRRGTTMSKRSPAFPARREGLAQLPDGAFPAADGADPAPRRTSRRKLEAAFPTRRLIIGRCAHLTEPTPRARGARPQRLPVPLAVRARLLLRRLFLQPQRDAAGREATPAI